MSGPKSVSYVVVSQAELDARERRRLDGVLGELVAREQRTVARARAERELHGEAVTMPALLASAISTAGDVAAARARVESAAREVAHAEARLEREIGSAWTAEISSALSLGGGPARSAASALADRAAQASERVEDWREETRAAVERVLERLAGDAGPEVAARIRAAADRALAAGGEQAARLALDAMREDVRRANEAVRARRDREARLDALREQLAGIEHPEADAARSLIDAAQEVGADADAALEERVAAAAAAARREADRRFAAATVEQCLDDLGYEVGGTFETLLVNDGYADVRRPEWRGYAVRVRAVAGSSDLRFNVVRGGTPGEVRTRDREVEEEWCGRLPDLLTEMRSHGLGASLAHHVPAGELPVQVVAEIEAATEAATTERQRPLERTMDIDAR